ncbi:MAG: NAD(P)H-hydrate dehydratase [Desulfohalobiaceae bacterium]|nr:NAD(P)H-hydrate dehydratase [Desulfohalobiaceae bacterium]
MHTPLPTPREMAHWDHLAIREAGIMGEILMENASREALRVLLSEGPELEGAFALFLAGSGNNGGDAFAMARHAADSGARCLVLHTRNLEDYSGEALYHARLCRDCGVEMSLFSEQDPDNLPQPDIVVDGLLGTGFSGELRQDYLDWVRWINCTGERAFVLALDIPSGMNGETGHTGGDAVRADCTVTFGACKSGLFFPQAREFTGDLHVAPIGIPGWIRENHPPALFALDEGVFDYFPRPDPGMHKGKAGHVLIVGGSWGMTGAPALAGLGALRSGAGLVTVACPADICGQVRQGWPELMAVPLQPGDRWSEESFAGLKKELSRFDAVVLGPGLGRDNGAIEFVRTYLSRSCMPTVFDADALFALSRERSLMSNLSRDDVLTPHPGEMARLLQSGVEQIQQDRVGTVRSAVKETGCSIVLKGPGSVVGHPEYPDVISPCSCFNLAVGGSGDVLAGVIGSLMARGLPSQRAACLGVYWHGKAGEYLESPYPWRGNLAQDIAHALPYCINT